MKISRAKARQRSIKGWETRRRKGGRKDTRRRNANQGTAERMTPEAGEILRDFVMKNKKERIKKRIKNQIDPRQHARREAEKKLRDWSAGRAQVHRWKRPNGEQVVFRGFKEREAASFRPALAEVDARTKEKIVFHAQIDNKVGPMAARIFDLGLIGGLTIDARENLIEDLKDYEKAQGTPMSKNKVRAYNTAYAIMGARKGKSRIMMPPQSSATRVTREDMPYVIVHELAHTIDKRGKYSESREFRQAAKWKQNAGHGTGGALTQNPDRDKWKKPGWTGGVYQGSSPSEDFAETYARAVLPHTPGRDSVYDESRKKYMETHILKTKPDPAYKIRDGVHLGKVGEVANIRILAPQKGRYRQHNVKLKMGWQNYYNLWAQVTPWGGAPGGIGG